MPESKDQRFEIAHISNSYHGPADSTKGFSYETAVYIADRINQTRHRPGEQAEVFAVDDEHTPRFDELEPIDPKRVIHSSLGDLEADGCPSCYGDILV